MRLRGKRRREFEIEPMRTPWIEYPTNRVVGEHRQVRVTVVGREVGGWNGYTEDLTATDLHRLAEWLERSADGAAGVLDLMTGADGLSLEYDGKGSLRVVLRGELKPWHAEETNDISHFELEVKPTAMGKAARELRAELKAWLE